MLSRSLPARPIPAHRSDPPAHAQALVRTPLGRRLRRTVPALAVGLCALALSVPTALPAAAAPHEPVDGGTTAGDASGHRSVSAPTTKPARRLTAAAAAAGVELGNAPMGWRQRGAERALPDAQRPLGAAKDLALARSTAPGFTPKGVLGIDVASYQGKVKWSTWAGRDKDFAYVKATEGTSYRNPYFKTQYKGAAKAGFVRGAYHFASPSGKSGWRQARFFVEHGGGWTADGKTLPGVLDIEYNPYGSTCYGVSKKRMVRWTSSFTREYKRLTGTQAVIYTTTDWWKRCTGNSDQFAETNPLWIARYGTKKPGTLPEGWSAATFWQYSASPIDQDVYPGKLKNLRKLARTKR